MILYLATLISISAPLFAVIKLRHYEKATKFEKISHLFWQNSCFYSVASKQVGDFFLIFVAFSKKLNFMNKFCDFGAWVNTASQYFSWCVIKSSSRSKFNDSWDLTATIAHSYILTKLSGTSSSVSLLQLSFSKKSITICPSIIQLVDFDTFE